MEDPTDYVRSLGEKYGIDSRIHYYQDRLHVYSEDKRSRQTLDDFIAEFGDKPSPSGGQTVELYLSKKSIVVISSDRPLANHDVDRIKNCWDEVVGRPGPCVMVLDHGLSLQVIDRE